jgi:acyl-CoA synthetase (AMP-forming)/AMP-acid ligase II
MALRRRGSVGPVDLGRVRVCITGAEPVRAATLRSFAEEFGPCGFDERAFSPAYGFAEAGVGVTMIRPDVRWSAVAADAEALAAGEVQLVDGGRELVSCGEPLPGYTVRIAPLAEPSGATPVGVVSVTGPSLFQRYLPGEVRQGASFETNDLAFLHEGELFVTGRRDDVVLLGGRNVYLSDIDAAAAAVAGVPAGRVQATVADGGYAVVAEAVGTLAPPELARAIRLAAVGSAGWNPDEVVIIERGSLPRTASGKPRRRELARGLEEDELPVIHRSTTGTSPM